jgi:hypothetical protein
MQKIQFDGNSHCGLFKFEEIGEGFRDRPLIHQNIINFL